MKPIQEQTWSELSSFTWGDLTPYQWMDFRITLADTITEQVVTGIIMENGATVASTITEMFTNGVDIVQSKVVMTTCAELITNIVVSDRNYIQHMLKCFPLIERKSSIYQAILKSYDREFRTIEQNLKIVERNIFIYTAIEDLNMYERDLGIETIHTLTYDQRREQIMVMYWATFDQTTAQTIVNIAEAYSGGEVELSMTDEPGMYEILFLGKGIPDNIIGLREALDVVMPAHLGVTFAYSYATWGELKRYTWGDIQDTTWEEIQVWDGESIGN